MGLHRGLRTGVFCCVTRFSECPQLNVLEGQGGGGESLQREEPFCIWGKPFRR